MIIDQYSFKYKELELTNISTGHIAASTDSLRARENGPEALAAARNTESEKIVPIYLWLLLQI